jgi:hypothetical protein
METGEPALSFEAEPVEDGGFESGPQPSASSPPAAAIAAAPPVASVAAPAPQVEAPASILPAAAQPIAASVQRRATPAAIFVASEPPAAPDVPVARPEAAARGVEAPQALRMPARFPATARASNDPEGPARVAVPPPASGEFIAAGQEAVVPPAPIAPLPSIHPASANTPAGPLAADRAAQPGHESRGENEPRDTLPAPRVERLRPRILTVEAERTATPPERALGGERKSAAEQAPAPIEIHIGRVEIVTEVPQAAVPAPRTARPGPSLDAFLAGRRQ